MLGKIEGKRRKGQQRMRWLDSTTHSVDMNLGKFWEILRYRRTRQACCSPWGHNKSDMIWGLNSSIKYISTVLYT